MKSGLIRFSGIISLIGALLFVNSCSFDSNGGSVQITSKPVNPTPADKSINQSIALQLTWDAVNANKFDVYLDTQNPPQRLYANNITSRSVDAVYLSTNTTYYWKVISRIDTGPVESDVWSFTTGSSVNPGQSGSVMIKHRLETQRPSYVNMIYQVLGYNGRGIGTYVKDDFELLEDDAPVWASESNLTINKKTDVFDTLKVVLMLDNSTSLASNIEQIRQAATMLAYNLVTTTIDGKKLNVQVAVYTFSEKVEKLTDFISDKDRLYGVIWDNYKLGKASTDLYGAVITGASKWTDVLTTDKIRKGIMIVFTDGTDTQGSRSYGEALTAVYNKKVFTIGLGNDIDPYVLERLGSSGYFYISDINQLSSKFNDVQQEIVDYINSFYVLKYNSPKRGNFDHKLKLSIKNNPNTGAASFIEGYYNSFGFSSN